MYQITCKWTTLPLSKLSGLWLAVFAFNKQTKCSGRNNWWRSRSVFFKRCSAPFAKKKLVAKVTCNYIVWSARRLMQVFNVEVQSCKKLYSLCVKCSMIVLWKQDERCSPLEIRRLKTNAFLNTNLFVVNRAWYHNKISPSGQCCSSLSLGQVETMLRERSSSHQLTGK